MKPSLLAALALAGPTLSAQNVGLKLTSGTHVYLEAPYSPTLVPRSGITVEAWITYDDATLPPGNRFPTMVRQNAAPGAESFLLRIEAGSIGNTNVNWSVRTSAGVQPSYLFFNPGQLNTWTHLAATYDGAVARIYLNGLEAYNRNVAGGALVDAGNTLRIGGGDTSTPGAETWNGHIDELRLWPFARTAAEINQTMRHELGVVPGEVSTWNLNGDGLDSSGGNHAAPVGVPTYATNPLVLTALSFFGGINFGRGTAGCTGAPGMVMTTIAQVGNAGFALGTVRSTATGAGVFWLATNNVQTPIRLLGAELWLDPAAPHALVSVRGGTLGYARVPLPIPNVRSLANAPLFAQTVWTQSGCAVPLFASDGLQFNVLR